MKSLRLACVSLSGLLHGGVKSSDEYLKK